MGKNTQLPVEVVNAVHMEAEEIYNKLDELAREACHVDFGLPMFHKVKEPIETALTAYATKLHQVEQENAELRRWNDKLREQAEASGPRWVPASKYEFKQIGHYPYRFREAPGEDYDYGEIYVTEDDGAIFFDVDHECEYIPQNDGRWLKYDILDESPAGREEDAVEFAQWLANERWQPRINTEWARYETIYSDVSVKTTAELYELFKQQKEGK